MHSHTLQNFEKTTSLDDTNQGNISSLVGARGRNEKDNTLTITLKSQTIDQIILHVVIVRMDRL